MRQTKYKLHFLMSFSKRDKKGTSKMIIQLDETVWYGVCRIRKRRSSSFIAPTNNFAATIDELFNFYL